MERRLGRVGANAGACRGAAREGGHRHLHSRQQRGYPALDSPLVRRSRPGGGRRRGTARRAREKRGVRLARIARHRRRPDAQPRVQPARGDPAGRVEPRPIARPRRARRRGAKPAVRQNRRAVAGRLLSVEAADGSRHGPQQPPRLARLRRVARGRAAGRRVAPAHARGQAPPRRAGHRAFVGCRAHVFSHHVVAGSHGLDAPSAGHAVAASPALHRRNLRLPPAGRQPAVEAAAASPAQTGARFRPRAASGHAKPRRPRLQGARQLRDVVHRTPANRP